MTPTLWQRINDGENIIFFLAGVVLSGVISGVCAFFRERRLIKNIVLKIKDGCYFHQTYLCVIMTSMTDADTRDFVLVDYLDDNGGDTEPYPTKENTQLLPESFGRNLDTLEKARLWLTNPHNWHTGKLFILKWNGLLCSIMEEHGQRLLDNPQDDGLPWCVVFGQKQRRERGIRGEPMEEMQESSLGSED